MTRCAINFTTPDVTCVLLLASQHVSHVPDVTCVLLLASQHVSHVPDVTCVL